MKVIYELTDGNKIDLRDISMISKIKTRSYGRVFGFNTHSDFEYFIQFKSGEIHYIWGGDWRIKSGVNQQTKKIFFQDYNKLINAWGIIH